MGTYTGTLDKAGETVADHAVEILDHTSGQLQLGIWEFCNIDLAGDGLSYTAAEGASCLVDLGDGRKPHDVSADVTLGDGTVTATVTFGEGAATWSYEGSR